jgi:hypothetical protein
LLWENTHRGNPQIQFSNRYLQIRKICFEFGTGIVQLWFVLLFLFFGLVQGIFENNTLLNKNCATLRVMLVGEIASLQEHSKKRWKLGTWLNWSLVCLQKKRGCWIVCWVLCFAFTV